jgi:hypothetical protein
MVELEHVGGSNRILAVDHGYEAHGNKGPNDANKLREEARD